LAFSLVSLGFTRDKLFLWASKEMNSEAFSYAKNIVLKFLRQDGIGRMDTLDVLSLFPKSIFRSVDHGMAE
jgi:hypothetical protein